MYLRLQPYWQDSVVLWRNMKLAPSFYGPYLILERIGVVAYKLGLPPACKIHPVFHVSQLKHKVGTNIQTGLDLPDVDSAGRLLLQPVRVTGHRILTRKQQQVAQVCVLWSTTHPHDNSWVDSTVFEAHFSSFDLEDKVSP